ncbi:MAG TPA: phosphonoacetaldehyde hydrolase [Caulobacteraceae bacterium]|jgi:phosphonoacetaldehyde hydrolase|nr:phosphonoacetaldehyde hydrolase [Caulobacteraceae bacterium]
MTTIKAVIFDWAGTMIDFGCIAPVAAFQAAFAAEGVALAAAATRRDMGLAKLDHVRALLALPEVALAWNDAKGSSAGEADALRIFAALEPLMAEAAIAHAELIPGAAAVFAGLKARDIVVGSCTGYTRAMMAAILPRAAEQGYAPDALVCAGETAVGRPSPLMLWKLLADLGVWPAKAVVKVDDAVVGVEEGLNAGCWAVGVCASGNGVGLSLADYRALPDAARAERTEASARALREAGAHFVIETVADLPGVLERIAAAGALPG